MAAEGGRHQQVGEEGIDGNVGVCGGVTEWDQWEEDAAGGLSGRKVWIEGGRRRAQRRRPGRRATWVDQVTGRCVDKRSLTGMARRPDEPKQYPTTKALASSRHSTGKSCQRRNRELTAHMLTAADGGR